MQALSPPRVLLALAVLGLSAAGLWADEKKPGPYPGKWSIERKDPKFDNLIPKDAVLENLADGMDWAEGPVWIPDGKYLLFSDIPKNTVWKWTEGKGLEEFLKPSGYTGKEPFKGKEPGSNGLTLDKDGRLVLCEHGDRRVARLDKDGKTKTTLADKYMGKRLNSPNDLVYKSNGDLYFTDPPYGLPTDAKGNPVGQELDFQGVYRLTPKGELTLLTKELNRPNGIAFSPDEKTLYVGNSEKEKAVWLAFAVKDDGTLTTPGRVFFDSTEWAKDPEKQGAPDGMKVDKDGNVFATGPGGVHVFSPEGKHLGSILTGVKTANVGWGDDGSVLYICADKNLCRIKTKTNGKMP
jgi:gluconolactonase